MSKQFKAAWILDPVERHQAVGKVVAGLFTEFSRDARIEIHNDGLVVKVDLPHDATDAEAVAAGKRIHRVVAGALRG